VGVIFISHSSKNNAEAVAVRDWLRAEGYGETFLDLDPEHGLAPGQRWEEELQKAGERCLAVVVLVSPDWCASKWCFHEFKFAKALGKKIFPVLIQPTPWGELPLELTSQFQMANISSPELREDGLTRLRFGLQRAGLDPKHFRLPEGRPPYRGLKALEEEDAAIFFGRDAQITAGLDALRQMRGGTLQRILTIAAASGAGKSSFLKAGLLARLKRDEENFLVLPTWRPGRDALSGETGLAYALGGAAPLTAAEALASRQASIIARFETMAAAANESWRGAPPTLVLPLDQAEELFSADNASASAAIELLLDVLASKPDLIVAATIRSDALGGLQADSRIAAQLRLFNLPALPPSAFREVIEGPARLTDPPITINPALTDRLIADLDKADALPLLAFTLERLVTDYGRDRTLSLQEYETGLGGVSGAINAAVEAALRKAEADPALPSTRHELDSLARAALIPWLVQLDEADASPKRRVARLFDIPYASRPLISHFIEERLLVASESAGETVVEVSHEAVLRHWRGLAAWISEERIVLERLQRLQRAINEWETGASYGQNHSEMLVHRGERLVRAEELFARSDLAAILGESGKEYITACRMSEDQAAARDKAQADREVRQRRRARSWQAMAALILVLGFSALAAVGWSLVSEQREFGRSKSLMLARISKQFIAEGDPARALALSILANRETALTPVVPEANEALFSSLDALKQRVAVKHDGSIKGALFSKDGQHILSWSDDKTARLWDAISGRQVLGAFRHEGAVRGADFSPDQTKVLTWSDDFTVRLWDRATGAQINPVFRHNGPVVGAIFSSDGQSILTWSQDSTARLWDVPTGQQVGPALEHKGPVNGAVFSMDRSRILTWSADGSARLWSTDTGTQIGTELRHGTDPEIVDIVQGAMFSQDQTRILSWSESDSFSGSVRLWDAFTGAPIGEEFSKVFGDVGGATFLRDDSEILYWYWDGSVEHRDLETKQRRSRGFQHEGMRGVIVAPSQKRFLTWGSDNTIRQWLFGSGEQIGSDFRHEGPVRGAVYSKSGDHLLSWSDDYSARLWNMGSRSQLGQRLKHDGAVLGATFSPDEALILTWSEDNTVRVWDWPSDAGLPPGDDPATSGSAGSALAQRVVSRDLVEEICTRHLRGSLERTRAGHEAPFPRLIDDEIVAAAPILRGREGEDVCALPKRPWWDTPLQWIVTSTGMD
jgi:WD40 repeat protein